MATVAAPVTVVTTLHRGVPHGTTVSAFASLSLCPPAVMVVLDRRSELLTLIRHSGRFGVNVLEHAQAALALTFARKGTDKFDGVQWEACGGMPRLPGALSWLNCAVTGFVDGGDHVVAFGSVLDAEAATGDPLTYHARGFGTHVARRVRPREETTVSRRT